MHGPTRLWTRAAVSLVGAVCGTLVLTGLTWLSSPPSVADPGDPVVIEGTQLVTTNGITLEPTQVTLHGGIPDVDFGDTPAVPQCADVTTVGPGGQLCIGEPANLSSQAGQIFNAVNIDMDGIPAGVGGAPDLRWLEEEAVSALQVLHGVSSPDIVRSYFRPAIRAYLQTRLMDILDKVLYDVEMSPEESKTYDAVMSFLQTRELRRAKAALREYDRWEADPCGYSVPTLGGLPVYANTAATPARCVAGGTLVQAFQFTKATPPVSTFEAWGAFRSPSPMLRNINNTAVKQMMVNTTAGLAALAGIGAAIAVGIGVTTMVGTSVALAGSILHATGVAAWAAAHGTISMATGTAIGASAAGGVFAIVLTALVIAAISIWMVVEEAKIPLTLRTRVEAAATNTDPLGILAASPAYAALGQQGYEDRALPPGVTQQPLHRQPEFANQLFQLVHEWTIIDGAGNVVLDPDIGYDDVPSTATDIKWRNVADPPGQLRDFVVPLAADETAAGQAISANRVHLSRGFLMVAPPVNFGYGTARPRPHVRYLDHAGVPHLMSIVLTTDANGDTRRRFALTEVGVTEDQTVISDEWEFQTLGGQQVTYQLEENPPVLPEIAVVPTIEGRPLPGQLLELRSHTSRPLLNGDYAWTLERVADDGTTTPVPLEPGTEDSVAFQLDLEEPGNYRATVGYSGPDDGSGKPYDVEGTVEFTIEVPQPQVVSAELVDDRLHDGRVFLDLRLAQETPGDTFDVEVEWADDNAGHRVVQDYTVTCANVAPEPFCETDTFQGTTNPTNPNWSTAPLLRLPVDQDFLPSVTMKVTNSYGGTVSQAFPIVGEHRAEYADRTPYVQMEVGRDYGNPGVLDVTSVSPSDLIPGASIDIEPFVNEIEAQLPEGAKIDQRDDGSGGTILELLGRVETGDIGLHTFSYPVQQTIPPSDPFLATGDANPPPASVTLDVVASTTPGAFRAILSPVEQDDPITRRDGFPDVAVQVPYQTPLGDDPADDPAYRGGVLCQLTGSGQIVFTQPCAIDDPFPWPAGLPDGDWKATVVALSFNPGETIDPDPYEITFSTRLLKPTLTVHPASATAPTQRVSLAIEDFVQSTGGRKNIPPPFAGYDVACRIDAAPTYSPCLASGSVEVPRTAGAHSLEVRVTAPDGAEVTRTASWNVGTPAAAFVVGAPRGVLRLGSTQSVTGSGLLPLEPFAITVGGLTVASGIADAAGAVRAQVVLPHKLRDGKKTVRLTGANSQRLGERAIVVASPRARLNVRVEASVRRGDTQTVVVRGLVKGEKVTVKIAGTLVSPKNARANRKGIFRLTFEVGQRVGRVEVLVKGAFPGRKGAAEYTVAR